MTTLTATELKSAIERCFLDLDRAMDEVLDHELDQETVAAISMGLSIRLVQLLLGRAGIDCTAVATSLCRELVALKGNIRGDMTLQN